MELILFIVFLALSLILITLGLIKGSEHSELSIIGFLFLFLMSFLLINQNVDYKVGIDTNTTYSYDNTTLIATYEQARDIYEPINADTHTFGYWLAVLSVMGFAAVFYGWGKGRFKW